MRQHGDPVAEHERLVDRVRDEDERHLGALEQRQELALQPRAGDRVEAAEGLVHQQHERLERQGAGDRDPLLHPAGELVRVAVRGRAEVHQLEERARALGRLGAARAVDAERVGDVVEHGAPGEELVELLEDDRAVRPRRRRDASADDDPPRDGRKQAGDPLQERRLAAAGGADDDELLAGGELEGDVADGEVEAVLGLVAERDVLDAQQRAALGGACGPRLGQHLHQQR